MADERTTHYRGWYAKLLRLYPRPFHDRFGESMEQTFSDLLREHAGTTGSLSCALRLTVETLAGIINENLIFIVMQNLTKRLMAWAAIVMLLLLIPLGLTRRDGGSWNWSLFDFMLMGALLFGAGLAYELVARKINSSAYRAAVGLAVATAVLLVWINGSVGIIGDGPINLLYFGVLAVGLIGSLTARFRPHGMSRTLFAMALLQALIPVIALLAREPNFSPNVLVVFALNAIFVLMFAGSALLFQRANATDKEKSG